MRRVHFVTNALFADNLYVTDVYDGRSFILIAILAWLWPTTMLNKRHSNVNKRINVVETVTPA